MLEKNRPGRVFQYVVDQIEEAIIQGKLKAGDRLPNEKGLQEQMKVSRGTLREALRVLEQKGLVERRTGAKGGVFAREVTTRPIAEGLDLLIRQRKISISDLARFRQDIEAGLIRLVVEKAEDKDIDELRRYLVELKAHTGKGAKGWRGLLKTEV
ncbi:MAG: FadR family transcriptional regulator, partial [Deltaproteobacteria bacterium]|nr:FadR family transcriptional regulator [Deltaproteobacteria bacterium]